MNEFTDSTDEASPNQCPTPSLHVLAQRRHYLKATGAAWLGWWAGGVINAVAATPQTSGAVTSSTFKPLFGFASVPVSSADTVTLPPGYRYEVVYAWGDSIQGPTLGPVFKPDASNTAAEQEKQCGMHNDGMHLFPLPRHHARSQAGLLCVNHEYVDDGLLHTDGMQAWSAEKVKKSQAAHGVSVVQIAQQGQAENARWQVQPSRYARRITAATPIEVRGPAAGHALLQTAADPSGRRVLGTFNNCANGVTPWGTYLTCEENFNGYFALGDAAPSASQARYGITNKQGFGYRWHEFDTRFDASQNPNEPHRFGWVVEIDPYDPQRAPIKRTALGRFKHEGATVTLSEDKRVVVYMGDDERNEYLYKFVSRQRFTSKTRLSSHLLDEGILYVARFEADGRGEWLPLIHGLPGLTVADGFADQATILIHARMAADNVGATKLDRPEWIALHPQTGEGYVTLTNNSERGKKSPVDGPNPRAENVYGQIVRWRENQQDAAALKFDWELFVLAGDPERDSRVTVNGDAFGSPDGLAFDARGVLWIATDVSTSTLGKQAYANLGNNMLLAADPRTRETRRFLVGPRGCEITGFAFASDGRTLFVNIQHPGESPSERSDPSRPQAVSNWPDGPQGGRPRSATIAIRRVDGGLIGT
ncbi:PhoX family protein [Parvibium lacunae]|uniref:PhoX family phosphatase n=1 Tax=Parvibium lacunae TaxID=1888893 RepID=A0A368L137_9BURK|nr:PhoX family phosphatase [Parvibium lacunae]RCS57147.1 PhoX family phosphatase [Parvibium lacunae]